MKKLITLTALLLCAVVSSWADDLTVAWAMSSGTTGEASSPSAATNITCTLGSDLTNVGTYSFNEITFTKFQPISSTKGNNGRSNLITNRYIEFSFTPNGGNFTPTEVSFDCIKIGTGDPSIVVDFIDGTGNKIAVTTNDAAIRRNNNEDETAIRHNYTITTGSASTNAVTLRIYIGKCANNKQVGIANVEISGTIVSSSTPIFTSNSTSITLNVNPITTSKNAKFTLTGNNLTDGTYNLTIPSVTGLSVSPTNFTVADGAVNQEFTVTYTSTADVAEAVANITATVDEIEAKVAVSYSSIANLYSQTPITGATTWDWSKYGVTTIGTSGIDAIYRKDVLVKNVEFYGFGAPADAFGPAQSLILNGDNIVRDNKYCQVSSAKFTTTVPGMLKVVFSNTGGDRPNRYLLVNGVNTGVGSNSTSSVTAQNIYIPAGEVVLTNIIDPNADDSYNPGTSSFIRIYSIQFTLLPPTTNVTVGEDGYRTFASKYPLDFTEPITGLKAYKATVSGSTVTFSEVTGKVPAKGGLLLKADPGDYTIPVSADEPAEFNNALVGVIKDTEEAAGIYVLMNEDKVIGFYKTENTFTVGANTAYLPAGVVAGARTFIGFDEEGEATGIEAIERNQQKESVFNLNGQRVAQPSKGLYIVNGKKVVLK